MNKKSKQIYENMIKKIMKLIRETEKEITKNAN